MNNVSTSDTALILIGYQNDYFAENGILRKVIEESERNNRVLDNTINLINSVCNSNMLVVHTPIVFTKSYSELVEPIGILNSIKQLKAFQNGTSGAKTIPEIEAFGDRIIEVPGKRGLNAFSNTQLDLLLRNRGIKNVILAGAVTSICIDSTGRSAFEKGYNVHILSDCTCSRTNHEQDFFCSDIFPLYATVVDSKSLFSN